MTMGNANRPQLASARRRRARVLTTMVVVLMLSGFVTIANAAPPSGVVEGVARDAQQHPLAGVTVRLQAADGSIAGQATSGADGSYHFRGVAAGTYSLTGEKQGAGNATATVTTDAGNGAAADLTLAAQAPVEEITVTAQRLNEARNNIEPSVGASTYSLSSDAIANMPGGDNAQLNQVLLQAPGVNQDNLANGGIHVRNEHLLVQYRINGVILPDGISFFGQGLDPRFVDSMDLITGALPAQYGLRTAGIVDIHTKSGLFAPGGSVGIYGGSYATIQPSAEYGGSAGGFNYFLSEDYLQSDHGINAPTPNYYAVHDDTQQQHGLAYVEKIVDPASKVSFIGGTFSGQFQIPNNPSATPTNQVFNQTSFDPNGLNENQNEASHFGVLSYLRSEEDLDYQVSTFTKYSMLHYHPDFLGDLAFNGIAEDALRQDFTNGVQAEGSYKLRTDHTLRAGIIVSAEKAWSDTNSFVFPADTTGAQTSTTPVNIIDDHEKTGWTYSTFLQDEWRITPSVTINYGGRFDTIDTSTHENQISPRLNTVWKPADGTTLHAGYARLFTPPPFNLVSMASINQFSGTTAQALSPGNSPVKAERADLFDVGFTQEILPGLKAGIDTYYKYSRNLIDEGQFGAPIVLTPFNYHAGFNKGVEITTSFDHDDFSYYGNLAIAEQKAEDISSAQFNFSPSDLAYSQSHLVNTDHSQLMTASAGMSYLWQGTRYSLDLVAGSGVRTTRNNQAGFNEGTVPSYEQVNLGASHRFENAPGGPIVVRFDIINLLDETYLLRSQSGIGVAAPQYGPRRSFFVGVRKEF